MSGEFILVIDDNPVNLKLTRILLLNEGYEVLTAQSAEEALRLLSERRPGAILTDIQLPGIDGLEFTRRVKADPNLRGVAVIAVTAYATPADELQAKEAGCDAFITKPIDTRTLGTVLRGFLKPGGGDAAAGESPSAGIPADELQSLRARFLSEGAEQTRRFLAGLDGRFPAAEAAKAAHNWAGAAGLLGRPAISHMARALEAALAERPLDGAEVREHLNALDRAFSTPE